MDKAKKVEVEKKRCPLITNKDSGFPEVCGEFRCAWWNLRENCCSIKLIGDAINGMDRGVR